MGRKEPLDRANVPLEVTIAPAGRPSARETGHELPYRKRFGTGAPCPERSFARVRNRCERDEMRPGQRTRPSQRRGQKAPRLGFGPALCHGRVSIEARESLTKEWGHSGHCTSAVRVRIALDGGHQAADGEPRVDRVGTVEKVAKAPAGLRER